MINETCTLTAADISSVVAEQVSILRDDIQADVAVNSPFPSVLDGGTFPGGGPTLRTMVTNRAAPHFSLTAPAFTDIRQMCGTSGDRDLFGFTEFDTVLEGMRGKGPLICVKEARFAVENSYRMGEDALKKLIRNLIAVDIRNQLLIRSGAKFLAKKDFNLGSLLSGGRNQTNVNFPNVGDRLPDVPMSFKALVALGNHMRDVLKLEMFGTGARRYYIFIGSSGQVDRLRNETGLHAELFSFVEGGYLELVDNIRSYAFIDVPFRGWRFGIDDEPLRFNTVDANGFPVFIEPGIQTAADHGPDGTDYVVNPDWVNACFEVGFIIAPNSFKRLVPAQYTGEGSFKFAPQAAMGELLWHYEIDNDCNEWGDFGYHIYQVIRAYQSIRPHAVIPVLHARCDADLGFEECDMSGCNFGSLSS